MSIKKNIFYNVSLSILNVLFPIVTAPYISRVLGVENIGVIRFVIACVGYFALFAALGISLYGMRELAKYRDDQEKCSQIFSSLFTIVCCSTLMITLFFILSINIIPEFKEHRLYFSLYGITLYLVPITMDWYFQAKENFRLIAIRSFVVKLFALGALFAFVRERSDIVPYILISVFSVVATQIWNLCYAYKTGLRIRLRHIELRKHVVPMLVFLCSSVAVSIFAAINIVMLGFLSSYEQVGYYSSSDFILSAILGLLAAMAFPLFPRFSFNNAKRDDDTNAILQQKVFDLISLLSVPMAVGLFLVSSRFVPLFFSSEFSGSIVPLQIISIRVIVVGLNIFFGTNTLLAFGYEKKYMLSVACAALLSFFLNFLFIPRYGATGAAIAIVIADSFACGIIIYFVYKITLTRVHWKTMGIASLFTLPFFVLYLLCEKFIIDDIAFLSVFVSISVVLYFSLQLLAKNYLVCKVVEIGINRLKRQK